MDKIREALASGELWWVAFGFLAQTLFFMRFLVQWIASERKRKSVMPNVFWYFSLGGGLMLFTYAVHRRDPVFILGQGVGIFVYLRNIILIHGRRGRDLAFVVILIGLGAFTFLVSNDNHALWGSSEARASEIAREMYETGEYVVPHLNGGIMLTKPPLYHWLAAASFGLFGVNEFAARLPSALAGIGAVLLTFLIARKMFGQVPGFLAAVMVVLNTDFSGSASAARTDMVFTFFIIAAIAAFFYAADSNRHARCLYILSFTLMGLAFMTKGPAGLFIPLAASIGYLVLAGRKTDLRRVPWPWGAALFLVVVLPWYVAVCLRVTPDERHFFLLGQVARWLEGNTSKSQTFWQISLHFAKSLPLYIPYILKGFFPWSFFLPGGIYLSYKAVRSDADKNLALPLVWFLAGVTLFSLSITKAGRYMVPMFPAAALMVAYMWRLATEGDKSNGPTGLAAEALRWFRCSTRAVAVFILAIAVVVLAGPWAEAAFKGSSLSRLLNSGDSFTLARWFDILSEYAWQCVLVGCISAAMAIGAVLAARRKRVFLTYGILAAFMLGALSVYNFAVLPKIDKMYNVKPFAAELAKLSDSGPIGWSHGASLETRFYIGRHIDGVPPDRLRAYLESDPKALVMVWKKKLHLLGPDWSDYAKVVIRSRVKQYDVVVLAALSNGAPAVAAP